MQKKMKNICFITLLFAISATLSGCEKDKLPEEIFHKQILLNQNGFKEYELNYVGTNERDTMITVAVSGSSKLQKDVVVDLQIDTDTLRGYNWEKYRNNESLYYELLPEDCYQIEGNSIRIHAGTEYTSVPIRFFLDRIDKSKRYILPISIASATEFPVAEPNYSTILMCISLANEFSGSYSLSGRQTEVASGDFIDVKMTRTLRVESPQSISLYAGNVSEVSPTRENYRIEVIVNADSTLTYRAARPDLIEIKADAPELDIKNPRNRITVEKTIDSQNSHKAYVVTTLYMQYNYIDKSNPQDPEENRWEGSCTRTRIVFNKGY